MAQAERISTAIREPMSRGRPVNSTNLWRAVQTEFLAAMAGIALRPTARSPIAAPNVIAGDLTGSALALSPQAVVAPQIGRADQADASPIPYLNFGSQRRRRAQGQHQVFAGSWSPTSFG